MESEDKRKIREMEETIRMKNKQIHQLLEDVEEVKDTKKYTTHYVKYIIVLLYYFSPYTYQKCTRSE